MVICGIKITHDGGVALIDNGTLKFSVEMEKLNDNKRNSGIADTMVIEDILELHGYKTSDITRFVIDGWHGTGKFWEGPSTLNVFDQGLAYTMPVGGYNERGKNDNVLKRTEYEKHLRINGRAYHYSSYLHVAGHVLSAYHTSPFALQGQDSFILVWDGGQFPRLYYYDVAANNIFNLGHLFVFLGVIYSVVGHYFGPYKKSPVELEQDREKREIEGFFGGYTLAGKLMAYIALGKYTPELIPVLNEVYAQTKEISNEFEHKFLKALRERIAPMGFSDEDVLATFHVFLEEMLTTSLRQKVSRSSFKSKNLCFAGGCALNIKWNSAIRNMGVFDDVYVPPFPNDSGSAIGVACAEMLYATNQKSLKWDIYSGPPLAQSSVLPGWDVNPMSIKALAKLIYSAGEPVVVLNGKAELGPRALGNRSIISSPIDATMKGILNMVKKRESYRPVAPICMEEHASQIFDPGCSDHFMLFDHVVKPNWKDRVPAICHLDGTARLQTVNRGQNPVVYELLSEFYALSGIPLLCNTSANFSGSGFFPSVESAMKWGKLNFIWSNGLLFEKREKVSWTPKRS